MPKLNDAVEGAQSLLGWELIHHTPSGDIGGIIIETEAYTQDDEASHSFRGPTTRTLPMFQEAGYIYMYFIYGMHWCLNIVTGAEGHGEAVLIRALKPTRGLELMKEFRKMNTESRLCGGPGSLVQALAIPPAYSGLKLENTKLELFPPSQVVSNIQTSERIGIKKAADKPWRFSINI